MVTGRWGIKESIMDCRTMMRNIYKPWFWKVMNVQMATYVPHFHIVPEDYQEVYQDARQPASDSMHGTLNRRAWSSFIRGHATSPCRLFAFRCCHQTKCWICIDQVVTHQKSRHMAQAWRKVPVMEIYRAQSDGGAQQMIASQDPSLIIPKLPESSSGEQIEESSGPESQDIDPAGPAAIDEFDGSVANKRPDDLLLSQDRPTRAEENIVTPRDIGKAESKAEPQISWGDAWAARSTITCRPHLFVWNWFSSPVLQEEANNLQPF